MIGKIIEHGNWQLRIVSCPIPERGRYAVQARKKGGREWLYLHGPDGRGQGFADKKMAEKARDTCPTCGGTEHERRVVPGNPNENLWAGELCPDEFHGDLPGYNCF